MKSCSLPALVHSDQILYSLMILYQAEISVLQPWNQACVRPYETIRQNVQRKTHILNYILIFYDENACLSDF